VTPQSWQWTERGETFAVVQLRAPEAVAVADEFSQDFYFLIDRSGSMAGRKWDRTCEALQAFVGLLGPSDRVSITLFDSVYRDFSEAPMPAPRVMADRGFQGMRSLGADGGTELLPAVNHVLDQIATHSASRRTTVVLITDGQVGNDQAIVNAFKQAPQIRVHTFGIDTTVNDAFLRSLARQQRGGCWLQTPDDDITGTIAALGDRLRRPVMTELSVRGGWEVSRPTWPDLHAREVVTIALRGNAMHPLEITGRLPDGREHRFTVQPGSSGSEAVKLLWANERILTLIESGRRQEAIALAKQHNLICDGTAFIAWDEAERIQVAQQEIVQPCLEPAPMAALRNMAFFDAPMPLLCDTLDASAEYAAPQACRSGGRNYVGEGMTNRQSTTAEDLVNRRITAVREFLQAESVAESIIAAAVAWTLEDGTLERLRTLEDAIEFAAEFRRRPESPITKGILERGFRAALASSPRDLVHWTESTRLALHLLAAE
jgi:hypothetical protein